MWDSMTFVSRLLNALARAFEVQVWSEARTKSLTTAICRLVSSGQGNFATFLIAVPSRTKSPSSPYPLASTQNDRLAPSVKALPTTLKESDH